MRNSGSMTHMIFLAMALCLMACKKHEDRPEPTPPASIESKNNPPAFIESKNNLLRVRHMVLSVTEFVLLHELGHMIVEDYNPPVIGQEENGADRFAALIMTPRPRRAGLPPEMFDPVVEPDTPAVMWATWFWDRLFKHDQERGMKLDYADSHGLDVQRSRQIMCLVYGSDPERFEKPFAPFLAQERREECVLESRQNRQTWQAVMGRRLGEGGWWKYEGRVSYGPAPGELAATRSFLMENRVLEQFAQIVNELNVPARLIPKGNYSVLEDRSLPIAHRDHGGCLSPGEWSGYGECPVGPGGTPGIVLCYNFVRLFDTLSRSTIANTEIGQREAGPGSSSFPAPAK